MKLNKQHLEKVLHWEGGFANDPHDRGGMTIFGIARKYNPNLQLWKDVDILYKAGGRSAFNVVTLENLKIKYRSEIEKVYSGYARFIPDDCPEEDAYRLFDFAVNAGVSNATTVASLRGEALKREVVDYYKRKATQYPYWRVNWQRRLRLVYNDSSIIL